MTSQSTDKRNFLNIDKMRYQENKLSANFVLLSLVSSLIALFTMINYDKFSIAGDNLRVIPDMRIGIEIGIGIVLMLVTFMASEKIKFYDAFWSRIGLFILAGINLVRIFNIPFYIYGLYGDETVAMIPQGKFVMIVLLFVVSVIFLVLGGVFATRKVVLLEKHMKEIEAHGHNAVEKH